MRTGLQLRRPYFLGHSDWSGDQAANFPSSLLNISMEQSPGLPREVTTKQLGISVEELLVILVIEDDQNVLGIVEEALTDGGFEPAIAASGEEAVTLLKGDRSKYRALVTDINLLGRLDGWHVARVAREIDPNFPVVYMGGKDAEDWASKGVPRSIMLAKPFAPVQLVTAVSQLLNIGTPTA
jgi:CheY-like chemotaxis protein